MNGTDIVILPQIVKPMSPTHSRTGVVVRKHLPAMHAHQSAVFRQIENKKTQYRERQAYEKRRGYASVLPEIEENDGHCVQEVHHEAFRPQPHGEAADNAKCSCRANSNR